MDAQAPLRNLNASTARKAADPSALEQAILLAGQVDRRRAQRLVEDLEWALALQAGRPEHRIGKIGRRRTRKVPVYDPVVRVL